MTIADPTTGEVVAHGSGPLAALESARTMLAQATSVDEVKAIRDKAEALRLYAKQAGYGLEMQNECAEIKLRAERSAGLLLAGSEMGRGKKSVTLADFGVAHSQSKRWQRIAASPDDAFEDFIVRTKEADRELTSVAAIKLGRQYQAADKPTGEPLVPDSDSGVSVYSAVVVDPPWRYGNTATRGAAEDHYPTMSMDELAALEIPAADDAHLYLWVTNSFIREGFDLIDAWGFTYKTCLTWTKPQIGMGNYFRNSTEHVLFAMRGSLPTKRNDCPTWFTANRTQHSAKPELFYDIVESSSPGPYMEMFARRRRFGWDVRGNEA